MDPDMKSALKIRVMLVDDHFVVRAGLVGALTLDAEIEVVAECDCGEDAIAAYRKRRPDLVLMDWRLPGISGVEATAAILREFPEARIVSLTATEGEEDIHRAVKAGVVGYLPKTVSRKELLAAIRAVHGGEKCFPPAIAAKLEQRNRRPALNDRELAVLQRIVRGRSNKEIAVDLDFAEVTVKFHVGNLLEKLGAADRTQAATAAIQRGIIHLD
jgi:DNA-binding NarL/FixJ family response regulator